MIYALVTSDLLTAIRFSAMPRKIPDAQANYMKPTKNPDARFGWDSIGGRYLYIMLLLVVFILATAWGANIYVNRSSQESLANLGLRQQVESVVYYLRKDAVKIQHHIYNYLLTHERRHYTEALEETSHLTTLVEALPSFGWIQRTPGIGDNVQGLGRSLHRLRVEIERTLSDGDNTDGQRQAERRLRYDVQPIIASIMREVTQIENAINAEKISDLTSHTEISAGLSRAIWMIGLVCLVLIGFVYQIFVRSVQRPLALVSKALKAEAEGGKAIALPKTHIRETDDLISTFEVMREQVHSLQQRLEIILATAAEGIVTFDKDGRIESVNKAAVGLFGYQENELVGKDLSLVIPPHARDARSSYLEHFMRNEIKRLLGHEGEVLGRHKDGTTFPMALKVSSMVLEGRQLYTGLVADISERKAMLDHLKNMAEHDGLTGLYNRTYFQGELERVVERTRRGGQTCALFYIDLDNFKYVNDTMGHAAGDKLLIDVASILHRRARKSDLIARFGGDEFTVLLYDISAARVLHTAESFRAMLAGYDFMQNGEKINVGCSIGVAMIAPEIRSPEEVMSHADLACHLAKRGGRNRVHLYQPADAENASTMPLDMGWPQRIKEAIESSRFAIACQPIVNTGTRAIESYEVLIRMLGKNNELIMPGGFLPSAERFGLAQDIDRWVINQAIDTLAGQRLSCPDLCYSINLSGQTIVDLGVCNLIQEKLLDTGLDPSALMFEVTETVAIADMAAAVKFLASLRAIGCRTAPDEFGSGMSSFAYLKDLPVDCVKIDGRFVKNLASNPIDQAMVKAMNDIVHALGKTTVAEFVENEAEPPVDTPVDKRRRRFRDH